MNYPVAIILKDGLILIVEKVNEAGPLMQQATGVTAMLSLRGLQDENYSAKELENGELVIYRGLFNCEIARLNPWR